MSYKTKFWKFITKKHYMPDILHTAILKRINSSKTIPLWLYMLSAVFCPFGNDTYFF